MAAPGHAQPAAQSQQAELAAFSAELEQVGALLAASLDGLYAPLSSLARAAVRRALPLHRAALVLAVACCGDEPTLPAQEEQMLRERRVLLAAALEMLAVALDIHKRLLDERAAPVDHSLDKSVMGSTILTGDYCFGRAAWLASQTQSPVVVDLFAQALKTVSEQLLRTYLDAGALAGQASGAPGTVDLELATASVHAAAHLAGLTESARNTGLQLAPRFVAAAPEPLDAGGLRTLSAAQQQRWQAALDWLAAHPLPA